MHDFFYVGLCHSLSMSGSFWFAIIGGLGLGGLLAYLFSAPYHTISQSTVPERYSDEYWDALTPSFVWAFKADCDKEFEGVRTRNGHMYIQYAIWHKKQGEGNNVYWEGVIEFAQPTRKGVVQKFLKGHVKDWLVTVRRVEDVTRREMRDLIEGDTDGRIDGPMEAGSPSFPSAWAAKRRTESLGLASCLIRPGRARGSGFFASFLTVSRRTK